jgi:hypothetical protein
MVCAIKDGVFNPTDIRQSAIETSNIFRKNFITFFGDIIGNKTKSEEIFYSKFEQRMFYEKHWKSLEMTMELINGR